MFLQYILYSYVIISMTYGSSTTNVNNSNNTLLLGKAPSADMHNKTQVPIVIEGGSITPVLALPKENQTVLMSLDQEFDKFKVKPVKPRKGVNYTKEDEETTNITKSSFTYTENSSKIFDMHLLNKTALNISHANNAQSDNNINTEKSNASLKIVPEEHKKPTLLSYEDLNADNYSQKNHLSPTPISSSTTLSNQLVAPNKINDPTVKGHPGMVMPIVITILVVPMFAILGYMAFKRGQEAWKNRHYKRMDFLLDGMYND